MLDKGIIERIVLDYKDIYKQALEDNIQTPAELPYFEGDFWPNVMEDNIRELEEEEAARKRVHYFNYQILAFIVLRFPSSLSSAGCVQSNIYLVFVLQFWFQE